MRTTQAIWLALALSTLACHQSPAPPHEGPRQDGRVVAGSKLQLSRQQRAPGAAATDEALTGSASTAGQQSPNPFATGWDDDPTVMIIRTGTASIGIDSLEPALARVRALAARVGGYVANTEIQAGAAQYRQATLEVKVPATRFDDLVTGLDPLGKLESVNVTTQDVGEEYVDVSARVTNSRRLESRLIDLLATRTGRLQDVLTVERELARVREEIERHEGRLRYLKSRSAMSSLSITVHEPLPVTGLDNVLVRAFERAWRNFVELAAGFIASLGVLVPLVVAGGTAVWGIRRFRRPATPRSQ